MFAASEEMHVEHLQNNAINFVEAACSVVAQPVEILLRPWYGTEYYPIPVTAFTAMMMLLLPVIAAAFSSVTQIIPFIHVPAPVGMFGIAALSQLYFMLAGVHAVRLGRRMLEPAREQHSEYEGPAWFFFSLLPRGNRFYFTRIVWEPAFVLVAAIVLQDLFIIQGPLSLYLRFAALALLMKNFISWFRSWQYIRKILNARFSAPIIAKIVEDRATEEEFAIIGMATFPKNIDPEIRRAALVQIERSYAPENQ